METVTGIVLPSGELVDPDDLDGLVRAYQELRAQRNELGDVMGAIRDCLVAESTKRGSRQLEAKTGNVEIQVRNEYTWHPERLEKLKQMGLPADRYSEMVTYYPKVKARVAFSIAKTNPEYAATIDDAFEARERREVRVS